MESRRETVTNGLSGADHASPEAGEEQVTAVANGNESPPQEAEADAVLQSPIYKLAEQLITEAGKAAELTKADAIQEAETEAAKIRADAEVEAREQVLEPARAEAEAKSRTIIAKAEHEAQQVLKSAAEEAQELTQAAKQSASHIESETRGRVQRLTDTVAGEIRSALKDINDLLPPSEESDEHPGDQLEEMSASVPLEREDGVEETSAPGPAGTR
jgi:vacuolar-type H+-ATPase subunit H